MTITSSRSVLKTYETFEILRIAAQEREMPAQLIITFLWIASHDGCKQESLMEAASISKSAVSRNVSWLSGKHRLTHRKGLNWIKRERDPDNWRAWRLHLTDKGNQLVRRIEAI